MATSSITKTFIVSGKEDVEMFANAIEESWLEAQEEKKHPRPKLNYRDVTDLEELRRGMDLWEKNYGHRSVRH